VKSDEEIANGLMDQILVQAKEIIQLTAELERRQGRERKAFVAGYNTVNSDADSDLEQAWQQYRCRDDSDFATVTDGLR